MSRTWKRYLDRVLQEGEMFGLVFTTLMLIVLEGCFVCWLHHMPLPDRPFVSSGFLAVPPWYQKPRFEITLLLMIAAGMLFSVCRGLWRICRNESRLPRPRLSGPCVGGSTRQHPWRRWLASTSPWPHGSASRSASSPPPLFTLVHIGERNDA